MKKLLVGILALGSISAFADVNLEKINDKKVTVAIDYEKAVKDFVGAIAIPCKHTAKEEVTCSIKNGRGHAEVNVAITHSCQNYWATTNDIKKVTIDMSTICGGEMAAETLSVNGKKIIKD